MHIKKILILTALGLALNTTAAMAQVEVEATPTENMPMKIAEPPKGPEGMWIRRKKGQQVRVEFRDGAMYCTIINRTKRNGKPKKDFEMCHGMTAEGDAWKGKKMKHPEMPGFMKFKGTVTVDGDVLKIKGCAGICDSEKWDRMQPAG